MKKVMLGLGMLCMVMAVSCKKDVPPPPPPPPPAPAMTPPPPPPPPAPMPERQDGTSVKVGSDGVQVKNADGSKKTDVSVSGGKATVEVKK